VIVQQKEYYPLSSAHVQKALTEMNKLMAGNSPRGHGLEPSKASENSEVPAAMPVPMPTAMAKPDETKVDHVFRYQTPLTPPSKVTKKAVKKGGF